LNAFDKRIQGDYEVEAMIGAGEVSLMLDQAQEFEKMARAYLQTLSDQ